MTEVVKTTSTFASAGRYRQDGEPASIAVKTWRVSGAAPKAVLQLNHGMEEYIDRYDAFAEAAAGEGYLVVGMDFIGHGDSTTSAEQLGYTGVPLADGHSVLLADMHTLRQQTMAAWPDLPYVMFAHSMGSFALRAYLAHHGDGLAGAVISGTGTMSGAMVVAAKALLGVTRLFHDPTYRSPLFAAISIGPYNKPFTNRTGFEWLSRDETEVDKYVADPRCGGIFTLAADRQLISVIGAANASAAATPKSLPLLLVSGAADPVGGMGKGVAKVADGYRQAGVVDVTLKLYDQARHELLNELNRDGVTTDILNWVDAHIAASA